MPAGGRKAGTLGLQASEQPGWDLGIEFQVFGGVHVSSSVAFFASDFWHRLSGCEVSHITSASALMLKILCSNFRPKIHSRPS